MRHRRSAAATRHRAGASEERSLTDARFIGSFPRADAVLDPPLSEIALVGRSNVGKSSLLNALAGRRVARVSRTPGKTRMLNVYLMQGLGARGSGLGHPKPRTTRLESLYLLDLPGYGFARASQADRRAFRLLITHTLARPALTGVLWLLDIRHEPSADDRIVHEQFAGRETPILAAFTKADKLSRRERLSRARELRETLALDDDQVIVTSARENEGIEELRESIRRLVG